MDHAVLSKGWMFIDEDGEKDYRILEIMRSLGYEDDPIDVSAFNCRLVGQVLKSDRFEMGALIKTNIIETIAREMYSEYYVVSTKSGSKYNIMPQWGYTQVFSPDTPLSEIMDKTFGF